MWNSNINTPNMSRHFAYDCPVMCIYAFISISLSSYTKTAVSSLHNSQENKSFGKAALDFFATFLILNLNLSVKFFITFKFNPLFSSSEASLHCFFKMYTGHLKKWRWIWTCFYPLNRTYISYMFTRSLACCYSTN